MIKILGVKIDAVTKKTVLSELSNWLKTNQPHQIVTINAEFIVEAQKNKQFRTVLNKSNLRIADGSGILWAAKYGSILPKFKFLYKITKPIYLFIQLVYSGLSLIFHPQYCRSVIPEKLSGSDLFAPIVELCAEEKAAIYLLGAAPGVAPQVAQKLQKKYPKLEIAGTFSGSPNKKDLSTIVEKINKTSAKVLFVAYSFPVQEIWINEALPLLKNIKMAIGIGGAFDFVAQTKANKFGLKSYRAPLMIRKLGLEWLFRLIIQPYRIKRIYHAVIKFTVLNYLAKFKF